MNRIYRLVWNRALGVQQAASELARAPQGAAAGNVGSLPARHRLPALRRLPLGCALGLGLLSPVAFATNYTVTDTASLSSAISNAGAGDTITFANSIVLSANLPPITQNVTIQGSGHTLDGNAANRGLFVQQGNVSISNLNIQNATAKGGDGGGNGGGGMGAGGGLFVNSGASVAIANVQFNNNQAVGGNSGDGFNSGGGGGLTGNGGQANGIAAAGNGLGGGGGGGGMASYPPSAGGGLSGPGGTAGNATNLDGQSGSSIYAGGGGGQDTGSGGSGAGFAGGGGGGSNCGSGGNGGFGGGGGGGGCGGLGYARPGGAGGFGGGGGGSWGVGGFGGGGGGTAGSGLGGGGGGAGFGGAVFVRDGGSLTIAGSSTFQGNTVQGGNGGPGVFGGSAGSGGSAAGLNLFLQGNGNLVFAPSSGQTVTFDASTLVDQSALGASGAWGLIQNGAGTLQLTGTAGFSGPAQIQQGTLATASDASLGRSGALAFNGGTLQYLAAFNSNRSIAVNSPGGTIDTQGFNVALLGSISGAGSLTKTGTGTLTLVSNNGYTGGTTVSAGTLQVGNGGTSGSIVGDVIDNGALAFNRSDAVSFAGAISGSGSLAQIGASQLVLNGTNTYTGGTTVQSGKLEVGDDAHHGASIAGNVSVNGGATLGGHGTIGGNVDVATGAHLSPGGSIGTLTIGGNATFAQGSVLDYEFGAPGTNFSTFGAGDSVKVGGNLALNGAVLNVTDVGGFGPGLYNLFTYGGSLTETNGGIALGTTPAGDVLVIQNLTAAKQINLLNTTGMTLNLWNGNGLANVTQMGGGNGTWTTTSPNWTDATGSVSAAMQPQPSFAIFGGTPGTVTVDNGAGNVSASGMQFASNGYTLTGGTLSLVGSSGNAPIIRVGDGSAAGATYTATINNVIAGTSGLIKSDLGTLVLTGANTYSGGTTINGGTLEVANNSALGTDSVTVDNTGNQGATLKVDSGITLANTIAIDNGSTLDNAGTISHTGATEVGVNATGGMATVTNHNGGSIAGGVIGLWLHTGGTVINTGNTSRIDGAGYALVTDGSPGSVVTNENGASIHGGTQDSVLMIQGGTLINQSGASISGDSVAVRMSQSGTIINQGGASISGTGASSYGVILHQGGTVTNQGGAAIQGGDTGIALAGASTITNAAGSSIIGGNTSVSVFGSGAVSLTNAGVLSGSVYLNSGDTNAVTLISGGSLNGNLYIGSSASSTLTLDGTGAQLYSSAVTGTTSFAGTLTKQGAGSWIVDSDLTPTTTVISAGTLQIGNGGTSGSLGGGITNNAVLVSNLSGAGTLVGAISGSGSLTQAGSGVLTLTGANSYTGGTTISAGTLQGNTTSLQGNITDNAMLAFNQTNAGTFAGAVSGSGALNKLGNGTLTLTGTNTHTGGTTISAGTLQLGNGGTAGSIGGNVIDNGTLAFDRSDAVIVAGTVTGSGALVQNGSGTLILTGANSYTGGTTISAGTLQGDTTSLQGNITDNAALVFNQVTAGIYTGAISGAGALSKTGAGTLTFNGSSPFSGATTVTCGKLVVGDDSHAGASLGGTVTVASGATLGGIGTIGGLNLAGTVTPGNSIGTLHVAGNATFQQGSSYQIEAAPNGSSDQIAATGKVTILGGSAVVLAQAGNWAPRTDYAIITGAQGISGQFASASSSLLFLDPVLSYTANAVNLSLQRNDISFASVAQTPNQLAVATVTNGLGFVSPMYSALTTLNAPTARHAFDQLSGEIHASISTALVDDSRHVREAINRHLLGLNDGTEGTTAQGVSVWTSAWGHGGHHHDDGNAASLQANGSGLLVGADLSLGSNSRLGAVVGHGQNSIRENNLGSSTHVLGDHVGVYGSGSFGAFVLRGGMAYARQNVHSNRAVAFGTYSDWLSSEHHAQTAQAYVEGGYQFNMSPGQQLEPFLNVAQVWVHSDALQEGGGNAALAVAGNSASVNTATLGLRDTLTLDAAGGIHAHATLGWQQAWGDLTPATTMHFVTGGTSFAVAGIPVARHALTTDLGIDFKLAKNVSVDASYLAQFASGVHDQGARMSLTVTF